MSYSNKILITGGLGFIGQNFAKHCLKNKFKIDIIDIKQKPKIADILFNFKKINYSKINLSNKKKVNNFFKNKQYDYVVHFAANFANQNSVDNIYKDMNTNIKGTINLLETIKELKIKKFIYISSSCVYPSKEMLSENQKCYPHETPYAISKFTGELYTKFYNDYYKLPSAIIRIFNTYGPGEKAHKYRNVIPNWIDRAFKNQDLLITGNGKETRDFTFIDDAIYNIFNAMLFKSKDCIIINSCTGKKTKIIDLAYKIIKICNSKSKIRVLNKRRKWDQIIKRMGSQKYLAKIIGNKKSKTLDYGLEKTIKWYKSNINS